MTISATPHPETAPAIGHAVMLITGVQAAGKSTIAQALAERLPRSVHVRGDIFRRMVVTGRAEMTRDPSEEAVRQLRLRHQLAATVSDAYFRAGFTVITQDVVLGEHLVEMIDRIRSRPLFLVVLAPQPHAVAARDAARGKAAYDSWTVDELDDMLRHKTPHLGLWLDTTGQTPAETVDEILARSAAEAQVPTL